MGAISTAVTLERRERVVGYRINKGFFDVSPGVLPQIIAIFAEANTANQGSISVQKKEITSAQEAGEEYGFGSPIHSIMRILRPISGEGVGGIPTVVYPQISDVAATPTSHEWTVTGTATKNGTHTLVIAGRRSVDFNSYSFSVVKGDTPAIIAQRISDAINGVLSSPVSATSVAGVVTLTTKWSGETSSSLKTRVDNQGNDAGLTYAKTNESLGGGSVDLADSLSQFGSTWTTALINSYGLSQLDVLEQFNGTPEQADGRYTGIEFKPFISFFGSVLDDKDDLALITDDSGRIEQVTNVLSPAPKSEGFPYEAAANLAFLVTKTAQNTPALDVNDQPYPDMPTPDDEIIGDMADYNNRDFLLKKGCSTVILENGAYKVQSSVTTYHKQGEDPLQYNYTRNLLIDWNIKDAYDILIRRNVIDHVLVQDNQVTDVRKSIKPKQWKAVVSDLLNAVAVDGLINDPDFSIDSLRVEISSTNPNRFDVFFRYRRTGIARIASTDVEAGF